MELGSVTFVQCIHLIWHMDTWSRCQGCVPLRYLTAGAQCQSTCPDGFHLSLWMLLERIYPFWNSPTQVAWDALGAYCLRDCRVAMHGLPRIQRYEASIAPQSRVNLSVESVLDAQKIAISVRTDWGSSMIQFFMRYLSI